MAVTPELASLKQNLEESVLDSAAGGRQQEAAVEGDIGRAPQGGEQHQRGQPEPLKLSDPSCHSCDDAKIFLHKCDGERRTRDTMLLQCGI